MATAMAGGQTFTIDVSPPIYHTKKLFKHTLSFPPKIILLHQEPIIIRAPSSNEIKLCAFEHHTTATDGTALLRGSDHAFDDFA